MIDLSISIVNTSNRELLKNCLGSIYHSQLSQFRIEVIVVDNASNDGSPEMVKELYPQVVLIENNKREGFSSNHNKAIRISQGKYILVLNEDTILEKGALKNTIEFMNSNNQIGVMGCKAYFPDGGMQYTCGRFPKYMWELLRLTLGIIIPIKFKYTSWKFMHDFDYSENKEVDWVCGVYFVIRRDLIEIIGYLDDNIFIYYEDVEYCMRMRSKTPYKVCFNPDIIITHYQGMSNNPNSYWSLAQNVKSGAYYFGKLYGKRASMLFYFTCLTFYIITFPFIQFINLITFKKIPQIERRSFMLRDLIKRIVLK